MALPAELQALLDLVEAAEAEARVLVNLWTDEQANWQPDGGRAWSVVQCFDHLVKTQALYASRILPQLRAIAGDRGAFSGLRPGFFGPQVSGEHAPAAATALPGAGTPRTTRT